MDHDSPLCVTPHLTDGWPPGSRRACQVRQMPGRYSIRAVGQAGVGDGGGGGWIPFWWVGLCWVGNCCLTGRWGGLWITFNLLGGCLQLGAGDLSFTSMICTFAGPLNNENVQDNSCCGE
jgi:hypothetical protein